MKSETTPRATVPMTGSTPTGEYHVDAEELARARQGTPTGEYHSTGDHRMTDHEDDNVTREEANDLLDRYESFRNDPMYSEEDPFDLLEAIRHEADLLESSQADQARLEDAAEDLARYEIAEEARLWAKEWSDDE